MKVEVKTTSDFSGAKDYSNQYNQLYSLRQKALRPILLEQAKTKWAGIHPISLFSFVMPSRRQD